MAVARLVESRAGSQSQLEKLQRRLLDKAEYILSGDTHVKAIELIAKELMQKTSISGRAVRHFFDQAQAIVEK